VEKIGNRYKKKGKKRKNETIGGARPREMG
jgi:hypothetical protein